MPRYKYGAMVYVTTHIIFTIGKTNINEKRINAITIACRMICNMAGWLGHIRRDPSFLSSIIFFLFFRSPHQSLKKGHLKSILYVCAKSQP